MFLGMEKKDMGKDLNDLLVTCETLWQDFNNCKAYFPHMSSDAVGQKTVGTAPFYVQQGFNIQFNFGEALSNNDVMRINHIGHWLNQNFVIRLCAVLEYFNVFSNSIDIDFSIEGAEHVNIMRRLRNCFAHTCGKYDLSDSKHKQTLDLIRDNLGIQIVDPDDGIWPIPINKVLRPLYQGCVKYSKLKLSR